MWILSIYEFLSYEVASVHNQGLFVDFYRLLITNLHQTFNIITFTNIKLYFPTHNFFSLVRLSCFKPEIRLGVNCVDFIHKIAVSANKLNFHFPISQCGVLYQSWFFLNHRHPGLEFIFLRTNGKNKLGFIA